MLAEFIDPAVLGFILIGVMLFSIFVGFPISFTLIFLGFVFGYLGFGKLVFYLMTLQFSMVMTEQTLAAVPLFVFMGIMMEQAGLMERLFSAFQLMLAKVRGSLYYAVLFVSVVFAAATGIVGASVTILGIMAAKSMLPAISPDGNLSRYLEQIRAFPMLEPGKEYMLAKSWKDKGDVKAAHELVTSHLRLVAKIAMGYRGYGLPVADLISEGNLGMMHAVKKFEPEKGFRLATYAMWWIKAAIQEYILRSWSLVKIGTTAGQKKLFFNLRRIKGQIQAIEDGDLKPEQVTQIATQLDVSETEVISMNQRMAGIDRSLNVPLSRDGEGSGEWQDWLEDDSVDQETSFAEQEEYGARRNLMVDAMQGLNPREQRILEARRLAEPPLTLEDLAAEFSVSRERIRQIEVRAFEKLQKAVRDKAEEMQLLPHHSESRA